MKDIVNISVDRLWPHPRNPRKKLGDLSELAESIRKNGIMQNLTVVPLELVDPDGAIKLKEKNYTVLIGHRRLEAAKLAGITELPCRIASDVGEKEQISIMLEKTCKEGTLPSMRGPGIPNDDGLWGDGIFHRGKDRFHQEDDPAPAEHRQVGPGRAAEERKGWRFPAVAQRSV